MLGEEPRKEVTDLAQKKYEGFDHQHLAEIVGEAGVAGVISKGAGFRSTRSGGGGGEKD